MTTVKSDIVAIVPTANAKAVVQAKGAQITDLTTLLQQHAIELQVIVRQVIALTPTGDANLTALNNLLSELM
jgi:hypothetical protein